MSYDFELFAASAVSLPSTPDTNAGNISIDGPDRVEGEDIPESFVPFVGKKRWLYRIHLEGAIGAEDRPVIDHWLREVILASKGVLIDLQTESYETVSKSGTIATSKSQPADFGSMSFYFEDGESFYEHGFEAMFKTITEIFPAALPTRYGHYEPLQGKVSGGDFAEIVLAFKKDTELFMKSPTPFGHIFLSVPCKKTFEKYHPKHFMRRHHLVGHVEFDLRPAIFSNPANRSSLLQLFKELCVKMNVVYAEILETEAEGSSWFWYGLPDRQQVRAFCIGPTYQSVWPNASHGGEVVGDRLRVFVTDRLGNLPPRPPSELIAPDRSTLDVQGKPVCARIFPFEYKFDYEKYIF
jgi:hypothetical protein